MGKDKEKKKDPKNRGTIFTIEYQKWDNELLCEFLVHTGNLLGKDFKQYVPFFQKYDVRGIDVDDIDKDFLKDLGVAKFGDRSALFKEFDALRKLPSMKADNPGEVIKSKITSSKFLKSQFESESLTFLDEFIQALSNKEKCKQKYFNLDWRETLKTQQQLQQQDEPAIAPSSGSGGMFSSGEESGSSSGFTSTSRDVEVGKSRSKKGGEADEDHEEDDQLNQEMDKNEDYSKEFAMEEMRANNKPTSTNIKIKFVLTDIGTNKNLRRLLSPIMRQTDFAQQFGLFHAALVIGPWYIDWNDSALCIPRRIASSNALISCDIQDIPLEGQQIEEIADKLAEVVVEWNLHKGYKNFGGDKSKLGNCQDFIMDVLEKLGIELNFSPYMTNFVKKMRDQGKCDISFEPTAEFKSKFGLKENVYRFETHQQLDRFVNGMIDKNSQFRWEHQDEYAILKSFDRAFWLRYIKFEEKWDSTKSNPEQATKLPQSDISEPDWKEKGMPSERKGGWKHNCPFDDPRVTHSFVPLY